jgi:UDP-GlcNAc:undecaprenyl-phosphate/decaprenyl-phosphate GlcNAc-1-phosphate transferase
VIYLVAFGLAFALCVSLTPFVRQYALKSGIVDRPSEARKIHREPVAYLGGVAIFVAFAATALAFIPVTRQFVALLLGCGVMVVVGVIDDKRGLSPWVKLAWQFVAAGIALAGGIGITSITSPFGGVIDLTWGRTAFDILGWQFHIMPIANTLSLLWMVGLANTINFLDGLDGLAGGVSGIAAVIMFALAVGPHVNQPVVALLAIILAGAALGFLPHNFYPARIFMGDSGAYFLGLVLAMLSIYSGAKLATAALVLGVPIVDSLWAVVRRLAHRTSPFRADRRHFHHLLLDAGLSQRQAVLILYVIVGGFGSLALVIGSFSKFVVLVMLVLLTMLAILMLPISSRLRRRPR